MNTTQISREIMTGMALAFFASAYAEQADECGQPLSGEIMDQLPAHIDPAATHAAVTLSLDLARANGSPVSDNATAALWRRVADAVGERADRECTPELFGHYCAMQAMGHGVGIDSFGVAHDFLEIPYAEFGSHSLQRDYFTETDAE